MNWGIPAAVYALIFVAQWGDPTQLATAALAGHFSKGRIDPRSLNKVSAVVFAAVGCEPSFRAH